MGYTTLPNSGLRTWDYGESGWITHFNYDVERLTDTLLKLSALLDVDASGVADGDILQWDSGASKWQPKTPLWEAIPATTTSTTSSTSSTTSSSSTTSTVTSSSTSSSTSSTTSSSTSTSSTTSSSTTTTAAPVTEFICAVGPGQADYATLALFLAALPTDLTASTTKVFGGAKTGTVNDNAAVTGSVSGATATVVHCSASQVLLESIAGGPFQSGEQVQVDGGNYFTTSDAGAAAKMVAEVATTGAADTAKATTAACATSSVSKVVVRAASGHEASTQWSTSKYRLEYTSALDGEGALNEALHDFDLVGVQVSAKTNFMSCLGLNINGGSAGSTVLVDKCLFRGVVVGGADYIVGIYCGDADVTLKVRNTIVYDFVNGANTGCVGIWDAASAAAYLHNDTVHNCYYGVYGNSASTTRASNTIANDCTDGFKVDAPNAFHADSDYNCSDIAGDAPGANSRNGADGTVTFADEGNDDFALSAGDSNAKDRGTSLAAHGVLPVTEDIDGTDRTSGTYDVGAHEYV